MRQARELCRREVKGPEGGSLRRSLLLEPEELVACLDLEPPEAPAPKEPRRPATPGGGGGGFAPSKDPRRPATTCGWPGKVCASLILEARNHPNLCSCLQASGWRLDARDAAAVSAAAQCMREDEQQGGGDISSLTDVRTAGLRYRLQVMPVCATCFCIYTIIHQVVTMIRFQRRDLWAEREKQRLREEEERERERVKQEETERMLAYQKQRRPLSAGNLAKEHMQKLHQGSRSLFLDADIAQWLHRC